MIYIKKLLLCDDEDNIVLKMESKKAVEGLNEAMIFIKQKDSLTKKDLKHKFWRDLDREFQNYFKMG